MNIHPITKDNYVTLIKWWSDHNWPIIPLEALPRIGFIVNDVVAGFLYATDSKMCVIEWIISDPKSDKEVRKQSIKILLDTLCSEARSLGFTICFTSTKNKGLIEKLQESNFIKTDDNMVHFIREI